MNINVAMLCDFAQVRTGLLFVSSGGISQLRRTTYPAPIGVMLALAVEVSEHEAQAPFQVRVRVEDEDGAVITELAGQLHVGLGEMDPGETRQIPLALDLRGVPLPKPGRYMIRTTIPGQDVAEVCLSFRAALVEATHQPPAPQTPEP
jgi:hypothetical protein